MKIYSGQLIGFCPSQEKRIYEETLQKGMNGPLNYYRTNKHRHDEEAAAQLSPNPRDDLPVLFMWGNTDVTVVPPLVKKASKFIKRLTNVEIDGVGHWITVDERSRDVVAEKVLELIGEVEKQKGKL
jgi:soluble epoxide hydrolase/lipid-phosphate phosphatase